MYRISRRTLRPTTSLAFAVALGLLMAVALLAAQALAPSTAATVPQAQAKTITKSGDYGGVGRFQPEKPRITKAWFTGGKLCLKGSVYRSWGTWNVSLGKGTHSFKISKKCKFGWAQEFTLHKQSKKQFYNKFLKKCSFVALSVRVKNGKAVRVWTSS